MAVLPLPRDPQGNIILPGKVVRTKSWPFLTDAALPSDLVASGPGSIAVSKPTADLGGVVISTTTTAENLLLANAINMASFEAIWWEVEGIQALDLNSSVLGVTLNQGGTNIGVYSSGNLFKSNGVTVGTLNINWSAAVPANYQFSTNAGIILLPRLQHAYFMMNQAVIADFDLTGSAGSQGTLLPGAITPGFFVVSNGPTAQVRVQNLRLTTSSY